jgi:hypothetical protein
MAQNGGCGYPVLNFGPTVTGDPLKCGTKLYHSTPVQKEEIVFCKACTTIQAAEEAATAPKVP